MMRYHVSVFVSPSMLVPICDTKGYENLGFAQVLALEISKGVKQSICVEHRCENEVVYAELFEDGRKTSV